MSLKRTIEFSEKDIEDWFWENPDKIYFIDGWIGRQITLNDGSRLDLLGYKKYGNAIYYMLIELKSNPLTNDDIFQVCRYKLHLENTMEDIGLLCHNIIPLLIGTGSVSDALLENANSVNVPIKTLSLDGNNEITISGTWYFTEKYRERQKEFSKGLLRNNKYDDLLNNIEALASTDFEYNNIDSVRRNRHK